MKRVLVDYHVHTSLCGHAEGTPERYVRSAARKGLKELGFSDHLIFHLDNRDYSMPLSQLPEYIDSVRRLQARFSEPRVKLGVEVDYAPAVVEAIDRTLNGAKLDYVLGSVHTVRGWVFDDERYIARYKTEDIDRLWDDYFRLVQEAARTGLFDAIAHPDLVKKFGYRPKKDPARLYVEAVDAFKEAGVCVEVNTSGLRKPVREIYPSEAFLRLCFEEHLPVTLGSDAHSPYEVAEGFEQALSMLGRVGYKQVAVFSGRQRAYTLLE
ncbi:MAG: histidinol-phosphatase HisJ family protein [Candidatus Bathyarchaeia archaeon]